MSPEAGIALLDLDAQGVEHSSDWFGFCGDGWVSIVRQLAEVQDQEQQVLRFGQGCLGDVWGMTPALPPPIAAPLHKLEQALDPWRHRARLAA